MTTTRNLSTLGLDLNDLDLTGKQRRLLIERINALLDRELPEPGGQGDYYIRGTSFGNPNLWIQINSEFTPAQAMKLGLALIASVKTDEVKITTNENYWTPAIR